jgi:signal transduction histidine kinase
MRVSLCRTKSPHLCSKLHALLTEHFPQHEFILSEDQDTEELSSNDPAVDLRILYGPLSDQDSSLCAKHSCLYLFEQDDIESIGTAIRSGLAYIAVDDQAVWLDLIGQFIDDPEKLPKQSKSDLEGFVPRMTLSLEARILAISPLMGRLLMLDPERWKHKSFFELFPARREKWPYIRHALSQGAKVEGNLDPFVPPDGRIRFLDWRMDQIADDQVMLRVVDRSAEHNWQQRSEMLLEDLHQSSENLRRVVHATSHDLKEPLRTIGNFVQLLQHRYSDVVQDDGRVYINYAVEGVAKLWRLLDRLGEYVNLDEHHTRKTSIRFDELLDQVEQQLEDLIVPRKVRIDRGDLPKALEAAPAQISLLFQHLISNAIRYNDKEQPEVEISAVEEKNQWYFTVSDNGLGIPVDWRDKVFVLFKRLHVEEEAPGSGMGLAFCKRIVELHGGRIWFDSVPRKGTAFHFTLPKRA